MNKTVKCAFCAGDVEVMNGDVVIHNTKTGEFCFGSDQPEPKVFQKFSQKERDTLKIWAAQSKARREIMNGEGSAREKLQKIIDEVDGDECPHGRSLMGNCLHCAQLNDKLAVVFGLEARMELE